jgi:hypothetical protein
VTWFIKGPGATEWMELKGIGDAIDVLMADIDRRTASFNGLSVLKVEHRLPPMEGEVPVTILKKLTEDLG